jgi:hypothetical protein
LLDQILLPMLFAMLGVSEVGAWNFASSSYAVDEFYTDRKFTPVYANAAADAA